ncbi:hypothetical protein WN944_005427 [Citrus x changshan-huyou]|uniref:RNase H type-1 domain-containing protein n=1 Tax=Citrus x changshan-huyou TaxID=2935761 RepID=A0AAP0M693_9ROSI
MEDEKDAFYVVRKGDVVGIYKTLSDCQLQAGFSVRDPSLTVYKGYGLSKEAEEYLASHGLKSSSYSVSASDVKSGLFGKIVPCPLQEPASSGEKVSDEVSLPKMLHEVAAAGSTSISINTQKRHFNEDNCWNTQSVPENYVAAAGSTSFSINTQRSHLNADSCLNTQSVPYNCYSCTLEFDGASKGNPGQAGAGAVLRAEDGNVVYRLREGVGIATNNVAEYRALILGLKYALQKGYKHIRVQGDSKLVCMQIQGLWKINNQNLAGLCKEAKELKEKFQSFQINHILRNLNSEADAQANMGIYLKGESFLALLKFINFHGNSRLVALSITDTIVFVPKQIKLALKNKKQKWGFNGMRVLRSSEEETLITEQEPEAVEETVAADEQQPVAVPVSPSDKLTMYFQADGAMNETAIPAVTQALQGTEGISDLKVQVIEGIATVELKKQTTVQATGVAANLVEIIQGSGFKLQTLNLSFDDEEEVLV